MGPYIRANIQFCSQHSVPTHDAISDSFLHALQCVVQGDSGFAVFRKGKVIAQSNPLQHFFDCPYQFAACPDFTEDTDKPEHASSYELQLESGDVVVAATDGLWDNLHLEELIPLLPTSEDDVKQVSRLLTFFQTGSTSG